MPEGFAESSVSHDHSAQRGTTYSNTRAVCIPSDLAPSLKGILTPHVPKEPLHPIISGSRSSRRKSVQVASVGSSVSAGLHVAAEAAVRPQAVTPRPASSQPVEIIEPALDGKGAAVSRAGHERYVARRTLGSA